MKRVVFKLLLCLAWMVIAATTIAAMWFLWRLTPCCFF